MNPRQKQLVLRALTRRDLRLNDLYGKRWVLCEKEVKASPPALYLPGDLDRVQAVSELSSMEQERRRILGGQTEHAATVAYELKNVDYFQGSLFKGAVRQPMVKNLDGLEGDTSKPVHLPYVSISSTLYGSFYFAHWLMDDLTLHLAAETTGSEIAILNPLIGHQPQYRQLFDIESQVLRRAHFDRVILFDDFGQNSYKRQRYDELRSRLQAKVQGKGHTRVFLRRSGGAARSLTNHEEIESAMEQRGFSIFDPMKGSVEEIAEHLCGAKLVVGVEGSHLSHALYAMADEGCLCVLQPPGRFMSILKDFTDCLGLRYAFVTGTEAGEGFSIDANNLNRLLDLAE